MQIHIMKYNPGLYCPVEVDNTGSVVKSYTNIRATNMDDLREKLIHMLAATTQPVFVQQSVAGSSQQALDLFGPSDV